MICAAISILVFAILLFAIFFGEKADEIQPFQLESYSEYIEKYPSDIVVGETCSSNDAKANAKLVWEQVYGETVMENLNYSVYYDKANSAWLVHGKQRLISFGKAIEISIGGVPYIIISQKDGCILAVWHTR